MNFDDDPFASFISDDIVDDYVSDVGIPCKTLEAVTDESSEDEHTNKCEHISTIESKGALMCTDCGEEIEKTVSYNKEWRYYGHLDTKHKSNPNRCQARKIDERNIFKDVEEKIFDDSITMIANNFYIQITDGKIHRGESRKGIVFACVYNAYKQAGKPRSCESLSEVFKIQRKTGLNGLKYFQLNIDKKSMQTKPQITPVNLVSDIMDKFSATPEQKAEVINLYELIKDKSSKINRARPQSVASGLTYYWIRNNRKNITLKEFVEEIGLSELTVDRISKEITFIIESNNLSK
jgi:transcription initiation factor TFIIIB Brf1 subunit/transcription initiation factor TFIIB